MVVSPLINMQSAWLVPLSYAVFLKVEQQACSLKNMAVHMTGDIAELVTFVYVKRA